MSKTGLQHDPLNIIITGVGGQGNVLLAKIVGRILVKKGFTVTVGDVYGAAQRGGPIQSHIRISSKDLFSPVTPLGAAHLIISIEPAEALRAIGNWGNPDVIVVTNTRPAYPFDVTSGIATYPDTEEIKKEFKKLTKDYVLVDASDVALELGAPVVTNIVMMGALIGTAMLPLTQEDCEKEITEQFADKDYELNIKAFRKGINLTSGKLQK